MTSGSCSFSTAHRSTHARQVVQDQSSASLMMSPISLGVPLPPVKPLEGPTPDWNLRHSRLRRLLRQSRRFNSGRNPRQTRLQNMLLDFLNHLLRLQRQARTPQPGRRGRSGRTPRKKNR